MSGVWALLHRALYPLARLAAGRKPDPTVVIMNGQSVKTAEQGGVRRFDGHKVSRLPTTSNQPTCRTGGLAADCWLGSRRPGRPFALSLLMLAMKAANSLGSSAVTDGL